MAKISEITDMKPSWEKAVILEITKDGIEIRVLKEEKRIFVVKEIHESISDHDYDNFLLSCREHALINFINLFRNEPFAELWKYEYKNMIICEARALLLAKALPKYNPDSVISEIKVNDPQAYVVILSYKKGKLEGIEELENITHRTIMSEIYGYSDLKKNYKYLTVDKDTIEYDFITKLKGFLPAEQDKSILWDVHELQYIKDLSKKIQTIPKSVKNKAIDRSRSSVGRKNLENKNIPELISIDNISKHGRNDELFEDPQIESMETLGVDEICQNIQRRILVKKYLSQLTDRQQEVLKMRYEDNLTQQQIADKLGIGRKTVSDIERDAYKKLKKILPKESLLD